MSMRVPNRLHFIALAACFVFALPLNGRNTSRADEPAANGVFDAAIDYAQRRCIKLYGAGTRAEAGYATGLIVSPDGEILVSQGIYLSGSTLQVVLPDGSRHPAKVVRKNSKLQAALLKIDAKTPDYFELSKEPVVAPGDWALAVSNLFKIADGEEPLSVNLGVVSARTRIDARHRTQDVPYDAEVLLIDAISSNPGAQGGAVVDLQGRLVGMIGKLLVSTSTSTRVNYAVPADLLADFVAGKDDDAAVASVPEPSESARPIDLGIRIFALGGRRSPAYIDSVVADSPAQRAGLQADDLILSIAGQPVRDQQDFRGIAKTLVAAGPVNMTVKRGKEIILVRLVLTGAEAEENDDAP